MKANSASGPMDCDDVFFPHVFASSIPELRASDKPPQLLLLAHHVVRLCDRAVLRQQPRFHRVSLRALPDHIWAGPKRRGPSLSRPFLEKSNRSLSPGTLGSYLMDTLAPTSPVLPERYCTCMAAWRHAALRGRVCSAPPYDRVWAPRAHSNSDAAAARRPTKQH